MQTSRAQGMQTLESSIKELVRSGIITREAAQPFLKDPVM